MNPKKIALLLISDAHVAENNKNNYPPTEKKKSIK